MAIWRPQPYQKTGQQLGIDPAVLASAIKHGKSIIGHHPSLTPVFTLRHLAALSGTSYPVLRGIVGRKTELGSDRAYRIFRIRKKISKVGSAQRYRTICIPSPVLLRVQRYIHEHILMHLPVHSSSIAYSAGNKIAEEIAVHCGCKWLIKVDVKNFFEAIPEQGVYKVFRGAGYPALISFEMARLCTRVVPLNWTEGPHGYLNNRCSRFSIAAYSNPSQDARPAGTQIQGSLPQGSPSSPLLANLCARKLDEKIEELADDYGLVYTRYADDLALSTDDQCFTRRKAKQVIGRIYSLMASCGLTPNTAKTVVVPPGGRKLLLGLYVDSDRPKLSRDFRYRLEQHLHFCLHPRVGPVSHAKQKGFDAVLGFKNHVRGLIAYAVQVDPLYGEMRLVDFNKVAWPF